MVDLSMQERQILWEQLNEKQKAVLTQYKKYRLQSLFLTEHFLEEDKWQLVDFKEDPHYPNGDQKLYCRCGRQVKYQFILLAVATGELLLLGSTHFAQHLGVSETVAAQVRKGLHTIDRGTDLILQQVAAGLHFPQRLYQKISPHQLKQQLPEATQRRLSAFSQANLPIYEEDQKALLTLTAAITTSKRDEQPWRLRNSATSSRSSRENPFAALTAKIGQLEVGEQVPLAELADYLNERPIVIRRWLGLLESERFFVQVKQVADDFFRIR